MTKTLDAAMAALDGKVDPGALDFSVRFDVEGEGSLRLDANGVTKDDGEADLVLAADADTFEGILSGDLNPASAMMSGKLSVEGDMGLAMKLGSVLS